MTTELFAVNLRAVREAVALELGCDPSAFDSHDLLFTPRRPEGHHETFFSMFVTFGTGTVVCLEPDYLDFAVSTSRTTTTARSTTSSHARSWRKPSAAAKS